MLTAGGVTLAKEVEAIWPNRHPADGTVASKGHDQRNPNSDHRPRPFTGPGVVRALDVGENTEDDGIKFAEMLRVSRDPRIKYVLHENRIFSSYARSTRAPWEWGPLSVGHESHVHVSFTDRADNDPRPWHLTVTERDDNYTEDDMWQFLNIDEAFVRRQYELGRLQPQTQATLDYFIDNLAELQKGSQNDVDAGFRQDWLNFRRAVSNGIALAGGGTVRVDTEKVEVVKSIRLT